MASSVSLSKLSRSFDRSETPAVDSLSLDVRAGEIVSLVGPSGCGKSTTLRMIAGLETPDAGDVRIGTRSVIDIPPQDRDVAMVFQGFALYPHMKVREILDFPLKMRKVARAERQRAIDETAQLLGIERLLDRRPGQLSGGEQQRVAMGRAIVRRPEVFLFDEPLSNLDAALRGSLRVELGKLLRRLEATALYVTHDQVEAMTLSDRIVVLRRGKLEQVATPREIYQAPASMFVASFFGTPPMNLLSVERLDNRARAPGLELPLPELPSQIPEALVIGIRPEHVELGTSPKGGLSDERTEAQAAGAQRPEAQRPEIVRGSAVVSAVEPLGAETHLELDLDGQTLRARVSGFETLAVGTRVNFQFKLEDVRWFDRSSGRAL